jgi:hypothetical protein
LKELKSTLACMEKTSAAMAAETHFLPSRKQ